MILSIVSFIMHPVLFIKDMHERMMCPECKVRPHRFHKLGCKTGATDGGYWA